MNCSEDWEDQDEFYASWCDCMDEEIDILEGVGRCWRCGNVRHLTSEQLEEALEANARAAEAWAEEMAREHKPKEGKTDESS